MLSVARCHALPDQDAQLPWSFNPKRPPHASKALQRGRQDLLLNQELKSAPTSSSEHCDKAHDTPRPYDRSRAPSEPSLRNTRNTTTTRAEVEIREDYMPRFVRCRKPFDLIQLRLITERSTSSQLLNRYKTTSSRL